MTPIFLSRSAIETYQKCQKLYWWQYLAHRRGLIPSRPIRALEMGTAIHLGLEILLKERNYNAEILNNIWVTIDGHLRATFNGHIRNDEEQWTLNKDIALCYGLVLTFAHTALPEWRITPWFMERDVAIEYPWGWFESKADYVGKNKEQGRFQLFNYKSAKYHPMEDGRADKQFKHDLQGITESVCIEHAVKDDLIQIQTGIKALESAPIIANVTGKLDAVIKAQGVIAQGYAEFKVDSVSYIFFIKGMEIEERDHNDAPTGKVVNHSPLVKGYRSRSAGEWLYAWANKILKPENKSGYGYLGKGWEEFDVFECEELGATPKERVEKWIEVLKSGLQEEIGNPLTQSLCMTPEKFRSGEDSEFTWEVEVSQLIEEIVYKANRSLAATIINENVFRRTRSACTYPSECTFKKGCFQGMTPEDMLISGEFKEREPHHRREREYWEGQVKVEKEREVFPKYD